MLVLDTNFLFILIEGIIRYVQELNPELATKANRLPCIIQEIDKVITIIRGCCSLDGNIYISNRVLYDEVMVVDPRARGLIEFSKYNNNNRREILRVLQNHMPEPRIIPELEVKGLQHLFANPNICPKDRDASLMVLSLHLGSEGMPSLVLTEDPDFKKPFRQLIRKGAITLEGTEFPTSRTIDRSYFSFLDKLHRCCGLTSEQYTHITQAYLLALYNRSAEIKRQKVGVRNDQLVANALKIFTTSINLKSAGV